MLVYLNGRTWSSARRSDAFADEVEHAMDNGIRLVLAHEMPSIEVVADRHSVEFDSFFENDTGATPTPRRLMKRGIYDKTAVTLKGSYWRPVSMAILALEIGAESVGSCRPRTVFMEALRWSRRACCKPRSPRLIEAPSDGGTLQLQLST